MRLVFLDTETTGLGDACDVWEIGLVVRELAPAEGVAHIDTEYCWLVRPDLSTAEPTGLRIGRYYERIGGLGKKMPDAAVAVKHPDGTDDDLHVMEVAFELAGLLDGATIVGAVPDFDARHLGAWLRKWGQQLTAHYHLVDVETLAAGALGKAPPWDFDMLLAAYGLAYDEDQRHTALGDAQMVRDLYDAVMGDHLRLQCQVDGLAKVIMDEIPGEPSADEGAVETAIRLLRRSVAGSPNAEVEAMDPLCESAAGS
jgi:hypothetical protein